MHEILPTKIARSSAEIRRGIAAGEKENAMRGVVAVARGARASDRQGNAMMKRLLTLAVAMVSLPAMMLAQTARPQAPAYCFDLSRITDLAVTKERFASIAGRPRPGNFRDARVVLPDWKDCSLYGAATYTCDSAEMETAEEAERARAAILDQVKSCLGAGWAEAADRSSPSYVVLHNASRPVSITLSTDQTDNKRHVVRLTVFVRRN
jgi:hypothetical protein